MKGEAAWLAWGAVHLALLSTGEDRAKAVVDWTWAGFTTSGPTGSTSRSRSSGRGDDAESECARLAGVDES